MSGKQWAQSLLSRQGHWKSRPKFLCTFMSVLTEATTFMCDVWEIRPASSSSEYYPLHWSKAEFPSVSCLRFRVWAHVHACLYACSCGIKTWTCACVWMSEYNLGCCFSGSVNLFFWTCLWTSWLAGAHLTLPGSTSHEAVTSELWQILEKVSLTSPELTFQKPQGPPPICASGWG